MYCLSAGISSRIALGGRARDGGADLRLEFLGRRLMGVEPHHGLDDIPALFLAQLQRRLALGVDAHGTAVIRQCDVVVARSGVEPCCKSD
jgi:hypothetical protein